MEFRILGPLEVVGPRGPIKIGGPLPRAVLALLVLNVGRTVTGDRLIDEIWRDDPPRGAQHALEVHVAALRRALGPGWIETQPNGYRLRSEGSEVDVERFESLVSDASRAIEHGEPRAAATALAAALGLWRGPPLGDLAAGNVARAERARLDELRALALERRVDAELACGHHLAVVPELRAIIAEMPLREAFSARLMLALYRSGRQADALDVYHEARAVLGRELGVEPGRELEDLQRAILDHDPSLDAALPAGRGGMASIRHSPDLRPARHADIAHLNWADHVGSLAPDHADARTTGPSPPDRSRSETRRTVTALVADVGASTVRGMLVDPESASGPLDGALNEISSIVERHGGTVEQLVGNSMIAMFGVQRTHEDDALRAVRAASEMRDAIAASNDQIERDLGVRLTMRLGINTGEVVAGSGRLITGDVVSRASRLGQGAGQDEILIERGTYQLVRRAVHVEPAGAVALDGGISPVGVFRLLTVTTGLGALPVRFDSPLVGRERERRQLESAFEQATIDETCQLFTLLGPAGVGKSRLVHEFLQTIRPGAQVLRGRCLPYGERIAFWPVAEVIRQAAEINESDAVGVVRGKVGALLADNPRSSVIADQVAGLIGVSDGPSTSEEAFWAVRNVFEAIARRQPLVVVFDDVQWAEPPFLDLIEHLAETAHGVPILLLCIARPEFLDERPGWAGGKHNAISVLLRPLAEAEVSRLVANLLGGPGASPALERRIAEASEGNPLFVEEFLGMLLDDGVLRLAGDEWVATADLATIPTPASIMALLAARLDRLPVDERDVLERGAVIGKVFGRDAIEALTEPAALPDIGGRLASLVHKELIRPDAASPGVSDAYRFKHILFRDAAYAGLPKQRRVVLHERLADWLAGTTEAGGRPADEVVGAHYEQAFRYRTELGPLDDRARAVGRMAAARLADVGRRANARGAAEVAADLLARAAAILPAGDREHGLLLVELTAAFIACSDLERARTTNDELTAEAEATGLEDLRRHAALGRIGIDSVDVSRHVFTALDDVWKAIAFFEGRGDDRALARAWHLAGYLAYGNGQLAQARRADERATEHARRVGDLRLEARALADLTSMILTGPASVGDAFQATEDLLAWARARGHLWNEAIALAHLGRLKAMVGEFDEGRRLLASGITVLRDVGNPMQEADVGRWIGLVEWLAGDVVAAEQGLRRGFERLLQLGVGPDRAHAAAEIARMLYLQARFDEAYEYSEVAEALWSQTLVTEIGWRGVRGMVLARRGDASAGLALVREAVAIAEKTDMPLYRGRALEDLAEVLERIGRPDEARPVMARAITLYEEKGITALAERARLRTAAVLS